jgi:hypothetical protein
MNFIKGLSSKINELARLIIFLIIVGYVVFSIFGNYGTILPTLEAVVPLAIILTGIVYLQFMKKEFAAHFALFVGFFLAVGTNFINSLLSLRFKPFGFAIPLNGESFIQIVAFLYLLLMIISLFLTLKPKAKVTRKDLLFTGIMVGVFFYLRGGIYLSIAKLLLPAISLLFGLPLATILFLLAGVADVPFDFLFRILNQNVLSIPISYYLFSFFAFYLIYGAVKGIIGELKKK